MEQTYQLQIDGQAVNQAELNTLGNVAGLADDRVFAELLRMTPKGGSVAKGILPYGTTATIVPNGSSGSVLVNPFRAFVGSRTAVGTDALENWRGIRSALVVATGDTSLSHVVAIAANASGNPRWDAIFAQVAIDANSAPVTRKVKDPSTAVVSEQTVSLFAQTTCTLGIVTGTAGATPAFPTLSSDSGTTYYILLGYVRVPTGFGASSTVSKQNVNESCAILSISSATGAGTLRPANQSNVDGGAGISSSGTSADNGVLKWTGTTGVRPAAYMPPSMQGMESIVVGIDLGGASNANWTHTDGAIIDDSRDWRNRVCRWSAIVGPNTTAYAQLPWTGSTAGSMMSVVDDGSVTATRRSPTMGYSPGTNPALAAGMGATFPNTNGAAGSEYAAAIMASGSTSAQAIGVQANVPTDVMAVNTFIGIYADQTTGALKLHVIGVPRVAAFFWLDFTAQYPNFR